MSTDQTTEQAIQAAGANVAPRITPADIEENIAGEWYFTAAGAIRTVSSEMVSRFLGWKFPADLSPDGGISFKRESDYEHPEFGRTKFEPTGTNLLDAQQARAMLEHVLQPAPEHESLRLLTFCVLVLRNGFTVTGESACASPANFNAEIGQRVARENAVAKIWPLMGYQLRQRLHEARDVGTCGAAIEGAGSRSLCTCGPNMACTNCRNRQSA